MRRRVLTTAISALGGILTMSSNVRAHELILAADAKPLFSVVRPVKASPAEELAARELAAYLGRITGGRFELAEGLKRPAVVVCEDDSLRGLVPGAERPDLAPEGYWLGAPEPDLLFVVGTDGRGLLAAVYDLLERLGCVWMAPALGFYKGSHESVPRNPDLRLSLSGAVVERPVLKYRKLYVEEGHSHTSENLLQVVEWMPRRRFNTLVVPIDYGGRGRTRWDDFREGLIPDLQRRDILIEVGGHGYENFLNAEMEDGSLFGKHPEWFGMDPEGRRDPARRRVFCTSNPDAVGFVVRSVLRYLENHPEIDIFDFWPPDGARWCECPGCRELGQPPERHTKLVSHVSEAVREARPDVTFECIAYSSYVEPPRGIVLPEAVLVDFCPINQCFEYQIDDAASERNAEYVRHLREWRWRFPGDLSIYSYYRKYAWNSLPNLIPHYMRHDLRFYRDLGIDGVSSYAEPGDWATYELNHYVLGALAWDPEADVDFLIDRFAEARYGSAAGLAVEAYALLEVTVRRASSIPFTELKSPEVYAEALGRLGELRARVERAGKASGGGPERDALRRLGLMFDYALRDTALRRAEAEGGKEEERVGLVDDLLAFIRRRADDGVFLHQRIDRRALLRRYGLTGGEAVHVPPRGRGQGKGFTAERPLSADP